MFKKEQKNIRPKRCFGFCYRKKGLRASLHSPTMEKMKKKQKEKKHENARGEALSPIVVLPGL